MFLHSKKIEAIRKESEEMPIIKSKKKYIEGVGKINILISSCLIIVNDKYLLHIVSGVKKRRNQNLNIIFSV